MWDMDSSKRLSDSIEGLYRAFAKYPLPADTQPCPCCKSPEQVCQLYAKPLRDLEIENLSSYSFSALLTWDVVVGFKHFLPRLFELLVTRKEAYVGLADPEIVFSKLRHGAWRSWPVDEQAAVEDFMRVVWDKVLGDPQAKDNFLDVETSLCSFGQCEDDLSPYLSQWIADERLSACAALSGFLLSSSIALGNGSRRDGFWDGREAQYRQLEEWAKSPEVNVKLRAAEERWRGNELANEFAAARSIFI